MKFLLTLSGLLLWVGLAQAQESAISMASDIEVVDAAVAVPLTATGAVDFDEQVRRVAAQTALAEAERAEQERLARAAAASNAKPPKRLFKFKEGGVVSYSDRAPHKLDYQVILYRGWIGALPACICLSFPILLIAPRASMALTRHWCAQLFTPNPTSTRSLVRARAPWV
jgi:hypothetical protein